MLICKVIYAQILEDHLQTVLKSICMQISNFNAKSAKTFDNEYLGSIIIPCPALFLLSDEKKAK